MDEPSKIPTALNRIRIRGNDFAGFLVFTQRVSIGVHIKDML
jgi:hypothetical protein